MAEVRPFRAVRYDMTKVGTLSDVVAPPYDVVDPPLQDALYARSPHNAIRLELTRALPGEVPEAKYARAADEIKAWRRAGVLAQDASPALYLYEQTFEADGESVTRSGFLARVRLERFGSGTIYPHEQTLAGPKADRLALFEATGFQLSPVFGLYPDEEGSVLRVVERGRDDRTPLEAIDHLGVINRLWPVWDQRAHSVVQGLMADKPIYIADGHHRYETALSYRDRRLADGTLTGDDDPANEILMMLVGMSDPGLRIFPTHRLVRGFPGVTADQIAERLAPEFELSPAGDAESAWDQVHRDDEQDRLAFGTRADGRWQVARLRSDATMDRLAAGRSADWRALGVSILHVLVLDHLLADLGRAQCRYVHSLAEVNDDLAAPNGTDLACLVPPATMGHVAAIASGGEVMPPKSTYFYPKLLTGLVFNPLR